MILAQTIVLIAVLFLIGKLSRRLTTLGLFVVVYAVLFAVSALWRRYG